MHSWLALCVQDMTEGNTSHRRPGQTADVRQPSEMGTRSYQNRPIVLPPSLDPGLPAWPLSPIGLHLSDKFPRMHVAFLGAAPCPASGKNYIFPSYLPLPTTAAH